MSLVTVANSSAFTWFSDRGKAFKEAREKNLPVIMYLYHPLSLRRDIRIFNHPLVGRYKDKFIAIHLDIETKGEIATEYGVASFPAVLFFDAQAREFISQRIDEKQLKHTELSARMKRVLKEIEEFSLLEQRIKQYQDNARMILKYAEGLRDRSQFERAEEQFTRLFQWQGIQADLQKEAKEAYIVLLFLQATQDFYAGNYGRCIEAMKRFQAKYPGDDATVQSNFLIGVATYESGDRKEGETILNEIVRDKRAGIYQDKARMYLARKKGG